MKKLFKLLHTYIIFHAKTVWILFAKKNKLIVFDNGKDFSIKFWNLSDEKIYTIAKNLKEYYEYRDTAQKEIDEMTK
jgi:hypothetical protein